MSEKKGTTVVILFHVSGGRAAPGGRTAAAEGRKRTSEEKGLLQMQHLSVCLQGTVGDHPGGINNDVKQ